MTNEIKRKLYKTLKEASLEVLHRDNAEDDYNDANDIFLIAETIVHIEEIRPVLEEYLDKIRKKGKENDIRH